MDDITPQLVELAERIVPQVPELWVKKQREPRFAQTSLGMFVARSTVPNELTEIYGSDLVKRFFTPTGPPLVRLSMISLVAEQVNRSCENLVQGRPTLNPTKLVENLLRCRDYMTAGKMPFTVRLRITNISLDIPIRLSTNIRLAPITAFPEPEFFQPASVGRADDFDDWDGHLMTAVCEFEGTPAELESHLWGRTRWLLANSILHPIYLSLSDYEWTYPPRATAVAYESPLGSSRTEIEPTPLSIVSPCVRKPDASEMQYWHKFLNSVHNDPTLETAVDRTLLGFKRSIFHENRPDEPNWDKVVDYVIALESLLLTVNGHGSPSELSYRFRLNGSSLLKVACDRDVRHSFKALKHLYELRSSVVHGTGKSMRSASAFLECFGINAAIHANEVVTLRFVCDEVQKMLIAIFKYCYKLPLDQRPYLVPMGWEEMLWNGAVNSVEAHTSGGAKESAK